MPGINAATSSPARDRPIHRASEANASHFAAVGTVGARSQTGDSAARSRQIRAPQHHSHLDAENRRGIKRRGLPGEHDESDAITRPSPVHAKGKSSPASGASFWFRAAAPSTAQVNDRCSSDQQKSRVVDQPDQGNQDRRNW